MSEQGRTTKIQCDFLTVHLGNLCTAWTTVDEHTSTDRDSALSIVLVLRVSAWEMFPASLRLPRIEQKQMASPVRHV